MTDQINLVKAFINVSIDLKDMETNIKAKVHQISALKKLKNKIVAANDEFELMFTHHEPAHKTFKQLTHLLHTAATERANEIISLTAELALCQKHLDIICSKLEEL